MTVSANWFVQWFSSPYYHKLYFERNEKEPAAFIQQLIDRLQPAAGSTILDAGCGRGQYSQLLAAKGFDVTGIDISPESIAVAETSATDTLHFYQHDIRLPFRINYFDYAFNFFTNFGYFKSEREHYNAIRTIANALKPGGIFVLDYLNVHYAEDHLTHKTEKHVNDVTYYITKWFDETHFYKKIIIEDEQLEAPQEFTEKIAKYTLGDFNDMFAFHYLQMQDVYGDYNFNPYDVKTSPRLIMIAKKK